MGTVNVDALKFKTLDQITAFKNKKLKFQLCDPTSAEIANDNEKTELKGRNNRTIGSIKRGKTCEITGENGLVSGGLLGVQLGTEVKHGEGTVRISDLLTVNSNTAITSETAEGTVSTEILYAYKVVGEVADTSKPFVQVAGDPTLKTGEFKYVAGTKTLTFFAGDIQDGEKVVVFYDVTKTDTAVITNNDDEFAEEVELVVDGECESECGAVYHYQYFFPRADFSGAVSTSLGGEQVMHSFSATCASGGCNAGSKLWDLVVYI